MESGAQLGRYTISSLIGNGEKEFASHAPDVSVSNAPSLCMTAAQQGMIRETAADTSPEPAPGENTDQEWSLKREA